MQMLRLDKKVVLITGAARGIGAATARRFVQQGARLVLVDLIRNELEVLADELGPAATFRVMDVADESAMQDLVAEVVTLHGRVDVAILNAGIAGQLLPFEQYPSELYDRVMSVNVKSVWLGLKYVMGAMSKTGGSIVITSSAAGVRATPNMSAYVASKHACIGLMRAAAVEGASRNIRVNTVNPSTIDTPLVDALVATRAPSAPPSPLSHTIPFGRHGTADEVAQLMLFLASDESSFCTGGVYMVDGGVSAGRAF